MRGIKEGTEVGERLQKVGRIVETALGWVRKGQVELAGALVGLLSPCVRAQIVWSASGKGHLHLQVKL